MQNNSELIFQKIYPKNLIIVSGITRSGKSLVCPIISSLKNCEKFELNYNLEKLMYLRYNKKISDEVFSYLFSYNINQDCYNLKISRKVNFRYDDFTSIWKSKLPNLFFQRMRVKEGDMIFKNMTQSKDHFIYVMHNVLIYCNLLFKIKKDLKIVNVLRNPIDIIYSWLKKNYGTNDYGSPRMQSVNYKIGKKFYPGFLNKKYKIFDNLSNIERIIFWIDNLNKLEKKNFSALDKKLKKNILFINHEDMACNTNFELKKINKFLKTTNSIHTKKILFKEKCYRNPIDLQNQTKRKKEYIYKLLSKDFKSMLDRIEKNFNKFH